MSILYKKEDKISNWFKNQYKNTVNFNDENFSEKFREFITNSNFPKKTTENTFPLTGVKRIESFLYLKAKYSFDPDGYICGVLWAEIGGTKSNTQSHFAYVYWPKTENFTDYEPEYISISPTFDSRDGEYRKRFICYETFSTAYDLFSEYLSQFEESIAKMISEKHLSLHLTFFPYNEKLARQYKHSRLLLKVFSYALALDLWEFYTGLLSNHTNSKYKKMILRIGNDYPNLIALSRKILEIPNSLLNVYFEDKNYLSEVKCGQKIIPLYYNEIMTPREYNTPSWKEVNITEEISNLVINYLTPSFPLYGDYTYIFDSDLTLFENDAMHNKYAVSDVISHTIHDLRKARETLGEIAGIDQGIANNNITGGCSCGGCITGGCSCGGSEIVGGGEITVDTIIDTEEDHLKQKTEFLSSIVKMGIDPNYNTKEYNAMLYEDIEYAHTHLIVSNISLLNIVEDVGWTLHSVNNYITKSLVHPPVVRELMTNKDITFHYIFNYLYGAYCMHTKTHIVHSDIHSNNLTIHLWGNCFSDIDEGLYFEPDSFDKFYKKATVVYATGVEDFEIYLFPATGINATIIDFSRAIVGDKFRPKLEEDGRGSQYATNFYRDQTNTILQAFNRYAPTFTQQNQEHIKAAILSNYDIIFPVLCCIDCMAIGGCLVNFFDATITEAKKCTENIKDTNIQTGGDIDINSVLDNVHTTDDYENDNGDGDVLSDGSSDIESTMGKTIRKIFELGGKKENIVKKTNKKEDKKEDKKTNKRKDKKTNKKEYKKALKQSKVILAPLAPFVPIPLINEKEKIQSFIEAKKISQEIEKMSRELLIRGLSDIVDFIKGEKPIPKIKSPAKIIIDKLFSLYSFANTNVTDLDIVDGYNYNNEVKYSSNNYNKYPPWANISTIEENLGTNKMTDIFFFPLDKYMENINKKKLYMDIIAEETSTENRALDGSPIYRDSSWV
jgi:hypothetical protein